jgi:zinc transport system substrate-binding protein
VKRIILILVWGVGTLALTTGCGGDDSASVADAGSSVVAAFYPLAFLAEQVGDDEVAITNLTPAGTEPHDLELSAGDVAAVQEADLVVYVGHGFQPALEEAVARRDGPSLDILIGQELLGEDDREVDPHLWLDPMRFASAARAVAHELGDPAAADDLVRRLEELDREFERGLERCQRRELVTSHAAFGYLADRYGLTQVALTGLSPEAEPTPRDLADLVEDVERLGATTVFVEPLVAPGVAETVARETEATTAVLNPLESLTAEQVDAGSDYFDVMRENLAVLREALGCV